MPVIMREVSVPLGTSNPNLLTGSPYELARGNVFFSIGVTAAAGRRGFDACGPRTRSGGSQSTVSVVSPLGSDK